MKASPPGVIIEVTEQVKQVGPQGPVLLAGSGVGGLAVGTGSLLLAGSGVGALAVGTGSAGSAVPGRAQTAAVPRMNSRAGKSKLCCAVRAGILSSCSHRRSVSANKATA